MKEKMYSRTSNSLLHDHIIDGFITSHQGLRSLLDKKLITVEEYTQLLEQNARRLAERVREFRLVYKMTCVFFAILFTWLQASGDGLDMRRSSRRSGRRRNETEVTQ